MCVSGGEGALMSKKRKKGRVEEGMYREWWRVSKVGWRVRKGFKAGLRVREWELKDGGK